MTAAAMLIRVEFERISPLVCCDFGTDAGKDRILAWLERRLELAELIERALELVEAEKRPA
jgi:hypothetical protein